MPFLLVSPMSYFPRISVLGQTHHVHNDGVDGQYRQFYEPQLCEHGSPQWTMDSRLAAGPQRE